MFISGLAYMGKKYKPFVSVIPGPVSDFERREILSRIPKIEAKLIVKGNFIFGYKAQTLFKIKNTTDDALDELDAKLKVVDTHFKKEERTIYKDLVDIFPKEKHSYSIIVKLGRRKSNCMIVLNIRRKRVELVEFHWRIT